jgi:hypothetical protein
MTTKPAVNGIALVGHPLAVQVTQLQLVALVHNRGPELTVFVGVADPFEARSLRASGVEVWHCGDDPPRLDLSNEIDRRIPGSTFSDVARNVNRTFTLLTQ